MRNSLTHSLTHSLTTLCNLPITRALARLGLALALLAALLGTPTPAFAATQTITGSAVEGNLRISVLDTGAMSVARYTSGAFVDQFCCGAPGTAKNSRLQSSDGNRRFGPAFFSNGTNVTFVSNATAGLVITTVWTAGNLGVTQVTTYVDGNKFYTINWTIHNNAGAAITDLRFFHGGDTFLSGGDSGAGTWNGTDTVGVTKVVGGNTQTMTLQGVTAPSHYESRNYATVAASGNAGTLNDVIDANPATDNGYALEWQLASLAAGADWTISAKESFSLAPTVAPTVAPAASSPCRTNEGFNDSATLNNGEAYYMNCFSGHVHVNDYGNHYRGAVKITVRGSTACIEVPAGYEAIGPTCYTDKDGGRKDFYIKPKAQAAAPAAAQSVSLPSGLVVGSTGGTFNCAPWFLVVNPGSVPNGSILQCAPFDPNAVAPMPAGLTSIRVPENVILFGSSGNSLTSFNPPLQMCYNYTVAELAAAGGDPANFVVITSPVGGTTWEQLPTTVDAAARRVCGSTTHLTLFELSARTPTKIPATGDTSTPLWLMMIVLITVVGAGAVFVARRFEGSDR